MTFKIISCGWNCEQYITQTLQSVQDQAHRDFEHYVSLAAHSDSARSVELLMWWRREHPKNFHYRIVPETLWDIPNRYETIQWSQMHQPSSVTDDDIIVFLDLDGDKLLPDALQYLDDLYTADRNLLMTYGNYRGEPPEGCAPPLPFPPDVIEQGTFRQCILETGQHFNHLRTMKGKVFKNIPLDQFLWPGTGEWYRHGTDYVFTVPALELAGWRHRCLDAVLMVYNNANPLANVHTMAEETNRCTLDFLSRPRLSPLT